MALISYAYNTDMMSVKRTFKSFFNLLLGDSDDSKAGREETEVIENLTSPTYPDKKGSRNDNQDHLDSV